MSDPELSVLIGEDFDDDMPNMDENLVSNRLATEGPHIPVINGVPK